MRFFRSTTLAGGDVSRSSLNPGMPSSSKTSSVVPGGRSCVAARRALRLYDRFRRLPATPRMRIGVLIVLSLAVDHPAVSQWGLAGHVVGVRPSEVGDEVGS